jgi:hypothetical protein
MSSANTLHCTLIFQYISDNSQIGIFKALATSQSLLKVSCILFASIQNAKSDFPAFAISGNSKGVVFAKTESSFRSFPALSASPSIVVNAIDVCSKSQAVLSHIVHIQASATHHTLPSVIRDEPSEEANHHI